MKTLPLGGQPDSVAISPDEKYAAIVLENQRDEDENDGLIPQLPPGQLAVIEVQGSPNWWPLRYLSRRRPCQAEADSGLLNRLDEPIDRTIARVEFGGGE